jgi:hypothetical protein
MKPIVTANQLSGRATGALIFTGFGVVWMVLGLAVREQLTWTAAAGIALAAAGLTTLALRMLRRARQFPRVPDDPAMMRAFYWVNAIQWSGAFVVEFTLGRLHLQEYGITAIGVIVGLHFFPLARIFRYRPHYFTGATMVLWAGLTLLTSHEHLQSATALGEGVILWTSAAMTIALGMDAARRAELTPNAV